MTTSCWGCNAVLITADAEGLCHECSSLMAKPKKRGAEMKRFIALKIREFDKNQTEKQHPKGQKSLFDFSKEQKK